METATASLPTIRQLPPNLINQIAAGEVIERPSSVVKELVENSIDAGALRIEVSIMGGGSELIRIADNGCGMTAEQLPLAISSHATSKLPDDEALFHVSTLGFRGEALASIGSVSHLTIRSRTADSDCGYEINVRGGTIQPVAPCGVPVGTVMEVRNLFFNTPVRHRFLKTSSTERGHITEAFTRLALANPHIHFVLNNNDKTVFDMPPSTRWSDRIHSFFGDEIGDNLISISSGDDPIQIQGYVCDPSVSRGNNRMQYLFLNGRHIRDRSLQHALGEAYRGLLMVGRFPVCFLQLKMSPELIDVNVHPTKLEVRFTDGGRVYSRLLQTLRHQFLKTDMTHRVGPATVATEDWSPAVTASQPYTSPLEAAQRQSVIQWARTGGDHAEIFTADQTVAATTRSMPATTSSSSMTSSSTTSSSTTSSSTTSAAIRFDSSIPDFKPFPGSSSNVPRSLESGISDDANNGHEINALAPWQDSNADLARGKPTSVAAGITPSVCYLGFQVHNRYLVTQDDDGMVVIDQHALHERVLYERVCKRVLEDGGALESQRLLVPEPVALTPAEHAATMDSAETLKTIGLVVEDFGGNTVLIQSYPAMLPKVQPADMLRTVLESLLGAGKQPDAKDLLNHLLSTIACKAAVKAGDPLTPQEITALLEQKDLYRDTHHCPHGRPTALFFSRDELDRMFGRLGHRGR
jgi:DNA mismatch repair protein MutL